MNIHVFTEIINCGKIGAITIKSYLKNNKTILHIYGTEEDYNTIFLTNPKIIPHIVNDQYILDGYKNNHQGLPRLWTKILMELPSNAYFIHFDSDVLFRAPIVDELIKKTADYDLIGCRRNQKKGPTTLATALFGFNKTFLGNWNQNQLEGMCVTTDPLGMPCLDHLDPISYDILRNGGRPYFFDFNEVGAVNENYSRENCLAYLNREIDVGTKFVHFAAVGSGMDVYLNRVKLEEGYATYAKKRYALFCKLFYNEDLGIDLSEFKNVLENKELFLKEIQ